MKINGAHDQNKTKAQLIDELTELREQVTDLKASLAECRQASGRLENKYQSYQFIVNTSRDFMTLINRDHVYEAANESYCQAHQKTEAEIVGQSVTQVWGEKVYLTQVKEHLANCLSGQEVHHQGWFEFATLGRRYFDVVYYPYYGCDGTVTHAVVVSRDNTKYKQVKDQLIRSEQRYRLVSDLTSNFTYAFALGPDDEFLLEWVTDAFTRITGFMPEEVNTRPTWIQITHPEEKFLVDRREQALLSGQMNVTEYRIVTKNGETRWLRDHIRPIWSRKLKRVVRYYGAVQDITERKQAEAERERFTNLLRAAAEVSRQLTAVLDLDQLLDEILMLVRNGFNLNHVHVYLLDETTGDLVMQAGSGEIGCALKERGHKIPLGHAHSQVARSAREREIIVVDDVNFEPNFMRNPLLPETQSEVSLPLVFGNNVLGVLDMQDHKTHRFQQTDLDTFNILAGQAAIAIRNARLVNSLRLSEERYELAASVGRVGVWDWNLNTDAVYLAPNLKAILGFKDHELSNEPDAWFKYIHPDDLETFKDTIKNHLEGKTDQFTLEHRLLHKDGTIRWLLGRGKVFRDENGQPHRMTGAHTDITELKEVAEALQYRIALEAFVTTMSTRFISLPTEQIDGEINYALDIISKFFGVNCICMAIPLNGRSEWYIQYKWQAEEAEVNIQTGMELPINKFAWGLSQLRQQEYFNIPLVSNLPQEAEPEKEFFEGLGFESVLGIPMMLNESLCGMIGLATSAGDKSWSSDSIAPLKLVSQMFVNALERKRAEEQIQASLHEKEVLLKEIHHRVKNNLQIISSLLYLHSNDIHDEQVQEIFLESQNRIKTMALIHENLYQTEDFAKIDLSEYIVDLVEYLVQAYGANSNRTDLKLNIDDVALDIDTIIPCGLIITELISNTLKYAFPTANRPDAQRNEIWITLRADTHGQVILIVGNNGRALPEEVDIQQSETLGMRLVNRLVQQLQGTIESDNRQGISFTITFTP